MYAWIWGHLPGNTLVRVLIAFVVAFAVVTVLFLWLFPIVDAMLPIDDSQISSAAVHGLSLG